MLVADLAFVRHPVELDVEIVLEDHFRIYAVVRRGTLWDTRIAPPAPGSAPDAVFFYFVLAGTMVWDAPWDLRVEGGQALVATQAALEGENGERSATHASFGEPFHVVQLRVARELVREGLGREPTLVPVTDEVHAALALFAHAPARTHDARVARTSDLLRAVHRAGLVAEDLSRTITREEGLAERMWAGAAPFFRDVYLAPSLTELSDKVGLSLRHVGRAMSALTRRFELPWDGWRGASLGIRLGIALLLLSSDEIPIGEVAARVGYSSLEALHHAFRAAGLPAPGVVRERLVARRRELAGSR